MKTKNAITFTPLLAVVSVMLVVALGSMIVWAVKGSGDSKDTTVKDLSYYNGMNVDGDELKRFIDSLDERDKIAVGVKTLDSDNISYYNYYLGPLNGLEKASSILTDEKSDPNYIESYEIFETKIKEDEEKGIICVIFTQFK